MALGIHEQVIGIAAGLHCFGDRLIDPAPIDLGTARRSAWLIQRFIDPDARFMWLKRTFDCPKRAVGFDFDGAEFTHVDSKVTFEVLLASFGLDHDPSLARLGALVHHLDVGGIPTAEGPGFASIMTGARAIQKDDDALLKAITPVLDSLYAAYARPSES